MMNHITYHYLLNGSTIDGKYLYDVNHLPNKALQEKVYRGYIEDKVAKLTKWLKDDKTDPDAREFAKLVIDTLATKKTLKEKANAWFAILYDRRGYQQFFGKPYFGVWGIHTTPANLFGLDPRYKYRIAIDLDTIDPDVIIIRAGIPRSQKDKNSNRYFRYNEANWDKYCSWFTTGRDWVNKAYPGGFIPRTVSGGTPDIMIFLPKLRIDKNDIEVYKG